MPSRVRYLVNLSMLSTIAYVVMVVGRIPVVSFLKYDPKDVIIVIGGLIYGPLSALLISVVVSLVEMITVSDTGWIGFVMNVLATCMFACTAAFVYKRSNSMMGAAAGLIGGSLLATAAMLLWNYLVTPIYMGIPRAAVAAMLLPVFLPFNLLKTGLNSALTMLIYKPVVNALRSAGLIPVSDSVSALGSRQRLGVYVLSALVLITCILYIMAKQGII